MKVTLYSRGDKHVAMSEDGKPLVGDDGQPIEVEIDPALLASAGGGEGEPRVPEAFAALQSQVADLTDALKRSEAARQAAEQKAQAEAAAAARKEAVAGIEKKAGELVAGLSRGKKAFGPALKAAESAYLAAAMADLDGGLTDEAKQHLGVASLAGAVEALCAALPAREASFEELVEHGTLPQRAIVLPNRTTSAADAGEPAAAGDAPEFDEARFRRNLSADSFGREILADPERYQAAKAAAMAGD